jgi:hypothetical protein
MTQELKNSLKIILNAYKEDKFTEEEVFTLLDSMINTNSYGSSIISYPYPVYPTYPSHPWESPITWKYEPYCTTSTNTLEINKNEGQTGQTKTTITG